MKRLLIILMLVLLVTFVTASYVKNVIYFIGDGMGFNHVYFASILEGRPLNMMKSQHVGIVKTFSANTWVTDSAAAGTALATGFKTNNGMIGMLPNGELVPSIAEILKSYGVKVGIVVTCRVTHATPAAFYGHVPDRDMENELAEQLIESDFDVVMGGGMRHFIPASEKGSKRNDGKDLIAIARERGYTVVTKKSELAQVESGKVLALFASSHLAPASERPDDQPMLYEMVEKALELLSRDGEPFFLMVEGSQIDWEAHGNDPYGVWKEVVEFDEAIGVALEFAKKNPDTLIVVTADHETGGLSTSTGSYALDVDKLREFKANTDWFLARYNVEDKEKFIAAVKEFYGIDVSEEDYAQLLNIKKTAKSAYDLPNAFGRYISSKVLLGWTTFDHTSDPVPIFAFGPGSEHFTGWLDNTDVPRIIARLMGCPLTYPIQKEPIIAGPVLY
ncbi:MAG: Alkaline phosphatase [Thermotoga sp. 50_1627]|uniref:alkaline phosphatase n=1 Tax=Pseudothermotoga sp. TaxID=2033661 RepID=UPI00076D64FA|nr:MAG: Alkaline phosphatase [Thermotoga sp. 50_64]KUK25124.1 MAG: Alkaline phosphatase [Thermotoga sp. 50_1627]MBC7115692.1 alkaline phosphatase [Pseudothermotoga sp.]HBT38499.1 alkaline phosphatase [Pseudothermotoga sp.]HCO97673.1 alkaline phosphatase [Pseudothermotoga sp.]